MNQRHDQRHRLSVHLVSQGVERQTFLGEVNSIHEKQWHLHQRSPHSIQAIFQLNHPTRELLFHNMPILIPGRDLLLVIFLARTDEQIREELLVISPITNVVCWYDMECFVEDLHVCRSSNGPQLFELIGQDITDKYVGWGSPIVGIGGVTQREEIIIWSSGILVWEETKMFAEKLSAKR